MAAREVLSESEDRARKEYFLLRGPELRRACNQAGYSPHYRWSSRCRIREEPDGNAQYRLQRDLRILNLHHWRPVTG